MTDIPNALYQRRYRKRRALYGDRTIDTTGTTRRIEALMAIGWSGTAIAERAGLDQAHLWAIFKRPHGIYRPTADRIAAAYDEMSMSLPPTDTRGQRLSVSKSKGLAARRNWAPPLAWDDIDTDPHPTGKRWNKTDYDGKDVVDEVVVLRILGGERLPANHAERVEATRRWLLAGGSARSLCRLQGWKEGRYSRVTSEGAA